MPKLSHFHREDFKLAPIVRMVNILLVILTLAVAIYARGWDWQDIYGTAAAIAILAFWAGGELFGLYRSWRGTSPFADIPKVMLAWLPAILLTLLFVFWRKTTAEYSRIVLTSWFIATPIVVSLWQVSLRFVLRTLRAKGMNIRTVAIVGINAQAFEVAEKMMRRPEMGFRLLGFFDDRSETRRPAVPGHMPTCHGDFETLFSAVQAGKIEQVFITIPLQAEERIREVINRLGDTTCAVYLVPSFFLADLMHCHWVFIDDTPALSIYESPFYGVDGLVKRVEDFLLCFCILPFVLPVMAVIAGLIKVTSRGPVIYRQMRYGMNGQEIEIFKFRTMTVCEETGAYTQATRGDRRVTALGAFLRRYSLDELPQFINVLQGRMSVVGPRPHPVELNEQFRSAISGYMLRHLVRPGITGLAQISGCRGETESLQKMEKRVEHDMLYIQNWSIGLDLQIAFRTAFHIIAPGRDVF